MPTVLPRSVCFSAPSTLICTNIAPSLSKPSCACSNSNFNAQATSSNSVERVAEADIVILLIDCLPTWTALVHTYTVYG
jgi:hypothetical protein